MCVVYVCVCVCVYVCVCVCVCVCVGGGGGGSRREIRHHMMSSLRHHWQALRQISKSQIMVLCTDSEGTDHETRNEKW